MVELMTPLVERRILLGKDLVELYGAVPEFVVAVDESDRVIGYGAIHAMWEHLGEVRTLGVSEQWLGRGVGHMLLEAIEVHARERGFRLLQLETGIRQLPAIALYESLGFRRIAPFGAYTQDPTSVCFAKAL